MSSLISPVLPSSSEKKVWLLSRAAAIDPGIKNRAAIVTSQGKHLLIPGNPALPVKNLVAEIMRFLIRNRIRVVAVGDPQGQFTFPIAPLKHQCWNEGILFVLGSEYCTSRKCPRCRTHHFFTVRIFVCPTCGLSMDRDLAGALNIFQQVFGTRSRLPETLNFDRRNL